MSNAAGHAMDGYVPLKRLRRVQLAVVALAVYVVLAPNAGFATHTFDDVPTGSVFHDQITWLASTGISAGCAKSPGTNFCPNDAVSRGQMAALLQKHYNVFAGLTGFANSATNFMRSSDTSGFADVPGMATTVTIPPGTQGRILATFSAESACVQSGDSSIGGVCQVRLLYGRTVMNAALADYKFDSTNGGAEGISSFESHAMQRYSVLLGPGTSTPWRCRLPSWRGGRRARSRVIPS